MVAVLVVSILRLDCPNLWTWTGNARVISVLTMKQLMKCRNAKACSAHQGCGRRDEGRGLSPRTSNLQSLRCSLTFKPPDVHLHVVFAASDIKGAIAIRGVMPEQ